MTRAIVIGVIIACGISLYGEDRVVAEGFHFYKGKAVQRTLNEILKEEREQTKLIQEQLKVQQALLKEIKQMNNPSAKIIKNDKGEECVANSSANCFEMPVIREVRDIPVIVNFMRNPSIQTAGEFLRWQSKWLNQSFDMGAGIDIAKEQMAHKLTMSMGRNSYNSLSNDYKRLHRRYKRDSIHDIKQIKGFILYIGSNKALDRYSYDAIYQLLRKIKKPFIIIYKDDKTREEFNAVGKSLGEGLDKHIEQYIDSGDEWYKKLALYTTPTILLRYDEKVKGQRKESAKIVLTGKPDYGAFVDKVLRFALLKGFIKRESDKDYKVWQSGHGQEVNREHYWDNYGWHTKDLFNPLQQTPFKGGKR